MSVGSVVAPSTGAVTSGGVFCTVNAIGSDAVWLQPRELQSAALTTCVEPLAYPKLGHDVDAPSGPTGIGPPTGVPSTTNWIEALADGLVVVALRVTSPLTTASMPDGDVIVGTVVGGAVSSAAAGAAPIASRPTTASATIHPLRARALRIAAPPFS